MGTDYDEFRKTCPCGQGKIRVGCSSPDHGWPSVYSVQWDANIECPDCQQIYMVDGTDQTMRIVRCADMAAVAARRGVYEAACKQFMASPAMATLKQDCAAHLSSMNSVSAIFRYLEANSLAGYAIGTFRKRWQGASDWADQNISVWNAGRIAGLLGQNSTAFALQLAQIETLKAAIGHAPTVMVRIAQIEASP